MNYSIAMLSDLGLAKGYVRGRQIQFKIPSNKPSDWIFHFLSFFYPKMPASEGVISLEEDLKVDVPVVKEIFDLVKTVAHEKLNEYKIYKEISPAHRLHKEIKVLGQTVLIDGRRIRSGLDKELYALSKVLTFLEHSISINQPFFVFAYPDFSEDIFLLVNLVRSQSGGHDLKQLTKFSKKSEEETNEMIRILLDNKMIVAKSGTYFLTFKGHAL